MNPHDQEPLIKGFAMDDARLKRAGGGNYFEELLARSSERVFWRKAQYKVHSRIAALTGYDTAI